MHKIYKGNKVLIIEYSKESILRFDKIKEIRIYPIVERQTYLLINVYINNIQYPIEVEYNDFRNKNMFVDCKNHAKFLHNQLTDFIVNDSSFLHLKVKQ